ncbi:hemicentin-2-like isoform X2 [Cottoperca gobio]|uniref:Hemicentin-2-like isoform X2 n=1 Tax=Cottoperca gobio TaxID=56716 RepID=A0A6J2S1J4_COTGO|nr:hemicentin-2-like isoform X2 [Cottoperca gobio]
MFFHFVLLVVSLVSFLRNFHASGCEPPDNVFFSVVNHTGPMIEGRQYTLQCAVQDVAPVENLNVTFYRGPTALGRLQPNNNAEKTPVTENFTLNITSSKEDDGVQYWCEAKLELGPEGPQQPPVVTSHKLTATVYYQPHLHGSSHPDPIIIPEGNPLQLNCSAVGNPRPSFNWTVPSDNPSPSNLSVLTINSVTSADNGLYTCCVSNNMGTLAVTFNVEVQDLNCTDKPEFTPSRLVVKHGDPTSASCSVCQKACIGHIFNVEASIGDSTKNGPTVSWTVDKLTEWSISPLCYYTDKDGKQCCVRLPITVYKPPDNVFFSVVNHTGPMIEGHQYTLQCAVQDVAPVENLNVTFYRGPTVLGRLQPNNNAEKTPVTENFTLNITSSKEDDGVLYWCEAELELGPEGPQQPPVVTSHKLTATVYYQPHLHGSPHPDPIIIPEGNPLQLNCSAVGNPRPSFNWTLPSDNPSPSNLSVLTINSVTSADNGLYTCCVSNNMGTHAVRFNVEVQANHIPIILGAIAVAVAVILILAGVGYHRFHRHNRTDSTT